MNEHLLVLGWVSIVLLHVYALTRMWRGGITVAASNAVLAPATAQSTAVIPVAMDDATQLHRLFAILDHAGNAAERAMTSHAGATKQLDSAEYQLLRLFDEFPMLTAARTRIARVASVHALIAPQQTRALAA